MKPACDCFDTSPLNGWPGDEDEGQMGAYVVLAGLGLFDMEGGCAAQPVYQISGPAFSQVTLHPAGGDLRIIARDNSATNVYIQSAAWNGRHCPSSASPAKRSGTAAHCSYRWDLVRRLGFFAEAKSK